MSEQTNNNQNFESMSANDLEKQILSPDAAVSDPGQGEAQDVSNETASNESSVSEEVEGPKEEEWFVPGQFRTKDDFLKSYNHIVAQTTKQSQEMAELRKQAQQKSYNPDEELVNFANKVKANPIEAIKEVSRQAVGDVTQELTGLKMQLKVAQMRQTEGFDKIEPVMADIIEKYTPVLEGTPLANNPQLLDLVYMMAKGVISEQHTKEVKEAGVKEGKELAAKKSKARFEGGSSSGNVTPTKFEDMSVEELEKAIFKQAGMKQA